MQLNTERETRVNIAGEAGGPCSATLSAYGTSYNCSDTSAGHFALAIKGQVKEYAASTRGLTLLIIDHSSLEVVSHTAFDTYGDDQARIKLAGVLTNIVNGEYGNVIFALASQDAIGTNATLAAAFRELRAYHWFQLPGLSNGPTHRHPYAAIGTSNLGIIKEALHSNTVGAAPSQVTMNIPDDWDTIGHEGYGPDLNFGSKLSEFSYTGTGYSFNHGPHLTVEDSGYKHIKDGEYVRMTGQMKVSLERKEAGGYVRSYFWSASTTDGWITSASHSSYSIEWERFELYFKWNKSSQTASGNNSGGGESIYLRWGQYHYPSSIDPGTSYIKDITIQKCGFKPNQNRDITLNLTSDAIDGKQINESVGPFGITNPDNYWTVFHSERNLTGRPNLGDSRMGSGFDTNNVKWFDRELTDRSQYSIHEGKNFTGDSNRYNDIGYVNIDPTKMYAGMIWHYCHEKGNGYSYLGTHTKNESGNVVPTYAYAGTSNTTNPYCMYPAASNIEKNTWTLWTYFFLPHWFTDQQGTDFYNENWCYWAGNYENASADNLSKTAGSRSSNSGNIRVSRFKESDAQIHLRWLDFYNTNANHKTWWALPMIIEIDPLDLGANGAIDPFKLIEDNTQFNSQFGNIKGMS